MTEDEILEKDPVKVAKQLQKLKGVDDDDEERPEEVVGRRKTAYNLAMSRGRDQQSINDLDVAFRRRMAKFMKNPGICFINIDLLYYTIQGVSNSVIY